MWVVDKAAIVCEEVEFKESKFVRAVSIEEDVIGKECGIPALESIIIIKTTAIKRSNREQFLELLKQTINRTAKLQIKRTKAVKLELWTSKLST